MSRDAENAAEDTPRRGGGLNAVGEVAHQVDHAVDRVGVIEAGKRWRDEDIPKTSCDSIEPVYYGVGSDVMALLITYHQHAAQKQPVMPRKLIVPAGVQAELRLTDTAMCAIARQSRASMIFMSAARRR